MALRFSSSLVDSGANMYIYIIRQNTNNQNKNSIENKICIPFIIIPYLTLLACVDWIKTQ